MGLDDTLKQLINAQNLKQADLCRMTGIQTSLMSEYLSGKKSPTLKNAVLIADALHISLDSLAERGSPLNNGEKSQAFLVLFDMLSPPFQDYLMQSAKSLLALQSSIQPSFEN